jgi:hypothetical protein
MRVGAVSTPVRDAFLEAVAACPGGTAEWLGEWCLWAASPASACVAEAARAWLPADRWLVVGTRSAAPR